MPLARWIVAKAPGWQVWSVERRENLLEDQSELNLFKQGKANATQLFDYYLGYLKDPGITPHFQIDPRLVGRIRQEWGMNVAVQDLHDVIGSANEARRQGRPRWPLARRVGGHCLCHVGLQRACRSRRPGRARLHRRRQRPHAGERGRGHDRTCRLSRPPMTSPWLSFGGIAAPFAGLFNATGSAAALLDPNQPSLGQTSGLLPDRHRPPGPGHQPRPVRLRPQRRDLASQPGGGAGPSRARAVADRAGPRLERRGALTPITRFATMFSGVGVQNADGTEWYFPNA